MRIIKQVFLYTTIIAVSILAVLVVFGFIYQDKIVNSVITEINKNLDAEIKVTQFEFSLLSHFPSASVNMHGVTGYEASEYSMNPDTLFHFKTLSLSFNVLDILQNNYVLESITVTNGFTNLEINKKGIANYLIVKSDTNKTGNFFFSLNQVNLENCTVGFRDFRGNDIYNFDFPNLVATGTFSNTYITTAVYGKTKVNKLALDGTSYLDKEFANVDVGVEMDLENQVFQISRGFVTLREKYDFEVKGKSQLNKYHYSFKASKLDLRQAETLIPKKHIAFINAYSIKGTANVLLVLAKGNKAKRPSITGQFDVWDGDFTNKQTKESIRIPKAKGRFDLGRLAGPTTTELVIEQFKFETNGGFATGKATITNLKHPKYLIEFKGTANLLELSRIYHFGETFGMTGDADFDFKLSGVIYHIDSVTQTDIKTIKAVAQITLNNVGLMIENVPSIDGVNAKITLNQKSAVVENLSGVVASSVTTGSFQVKNWLNYIISPTHTMEILVDLKTQKIETSQWIPKTQAETNKSQFSLPKNLILRGHVKADEFRHDQSYFTNFSTNISYKPFQLRLSNTRFTAFDGELKSEFEMSQSESKIWYKIDLTAQNVSVQKLLGMYDNFGQTAVTEDHLQGDLSCSLTATFVSDRRFSIDNSSIELDGDFMILNGEMNENKLLVQIPSEIESNKVIDLFVNLDAFEKRLHHITFDTISNHLSIKNSVLTVPQMHISSSALQIDIKGTHSFKNEVDYYLSFSLEEVLAKKKKVRTEYGYIVDDGYGNRMMFLHMYTKNGQIQVDLDKEGARKNRQSRSLEETKEVKSILTEEFGFFKNDSTLDGSKPEPKFEYEIDLGEFAEDSTSSQSDSNLVRSDSSKKVVNGKKKKKKKKSNTEEEEFEEFDFEDDDY